jgi:putative SOS response-associated peptidase YedK
MCGRFVGFRKLEELILHFPIDVSDVEVTENFNVAPTQQVLGIVQYGDQNHLQKFHWGLVPFWAKDKTIGSRSWIVLPRISQDGKGITQSLGNSLKGSF